MRQINYYYLDLRKPKGQNTPAVPILLKDANFHNENKLDIYWTFNEFSEFGKRKKENLTKIWCFYCEIDGGVTQEQILHKLKNHLLPSLIIKSFNGFHLYWYLDKPIDCTDDPVGWADWFREFVMKRIRHIFDADPQSCDACRLLRAPFYRYWKRQKDGSCPDGSYYIDIVYDNEKTKYSLAQIEQYFPQPAEMHEERISTHKIFNVPSGSFWSRANQLPVVDSLKTLSGTSNVSGENFTFKKKRDGTIRIHCNGNPSNAWIDRNGLIGSTVDAGPAIPNWLWFYHRDWKKVAKILKEVFPHLEENK